MGKYSRLGRNTLLVFIGNIGSKMISFVMLPFYTIWLSVSDYGTTDMISVYVSFFISIITLCLAESVFIFPKDQDFVHQKRYFTSGLAIYALSFTLTGILFYIARLALQLHSINNTFTEYTWVIYAMLISTALQFYLQQFSRSLNKIKVYAASGIVLTLCTAIFSFYLIPKFGLYGYFTAQIIALAITSMYTFIFSKAYKYASFSNISKKAYLEMLKYSIPLIPNGVMWWVISAISRPITEEYLGLHEVGIFAVANKFPAILALLFSIFSYSWQISVLEEFKKEGYQQFYNKMNQIVFSAMILMSCAIAIFSPLLISITDDKFHTASQYIPIISLGVVFSSFSGMVGATFSAVKKSKYYFFSSIWAAVVNIILSFLLIPKYGLYGASIGIVISHFVMVITRLIYSWKYVKLERPLKYILMVLINVAIILMLNYIGITKHSIIYISLLFIFYLFLNKNILSEFKIKKG